METNDEATAFAEFTFYLDSAVVQFDDTFRESQSDAGTNAGGKAIHLFGLIETVEYLIYLFGIDAAAGISHTDDGFVTFGGNTEGNGIFCLGVLDGIGQEVVDNLLHLFLVVPYFKAFAVFLEVETNLLAAGILHKDQIVLIEEMYDIVRTDFYFHMPLFLFAEVKEFSDQFAQLDTILVNTQYLIIDSGCEVLQLHQGFHLRHDKGKRGTEFV